ncbi:His-Xaa-Ser system radical SAM maturase HxsB [Candidatus Gracilibacteria bacterium CG1_02_38_174]|nr:MAG: His-Xaa-Ser system radical SAM maturase HxsB [Candidatus Gracilibacteria bacterium CG1_02_38_174]PIQ11777.1 MAG: His-Xaa-Ser system radical SAM maturase HxsB [Candidatus Gracilibacteria bacterium CG18_big_fil_WC_8_21_14_2_50_38_16]PIQ41398.1 MAG: His-Xaa-Ser system radical SAM maturase HxsB [Candidatus Gracilibacteria bacterium CG12_big_fil_rev_8_21_14_0_65_38_15]PIZ01415.1 MAG: His-Xaa-Ser system radical SAM maturase HxsB [Candidatus Gracilibacteria bacterium CG_4_10_14_0_8_um_filter_38
MMNLEKIKALRNDTIGFFRFKKFDADTYLITNDIAKYSFLTGKEFSDFIAGKLVSGEKYEELKSRKFIKDANYEQDMTVGFAKKNQFLAYGPVLHIIVTTLRCNHKCQYCHAAVAPMTAKDMDMTEETAKKVVDTIFYTSSPDLTIEFQGGESLVNWDIVKYVVEYAETKMVHLAKNVTFALVTNLSLMDEEKLQYLLDHNIQISTSLDGDEETHNFNRTFKDGNSFEKVTYWIRRINAEYEKRGLKNKIGALLTVTKKTLPRYKEVIDTYVNLGLDSIFLRPLNPYGFAAADLEKLGYAPEEFIEFYKSSMDYILELNKKGVTIRENLSAIYLSKILTDKDPNYLDERSPCGACIGQVAYNYDGKIYSCDEGRMLARMGDDNFLMTEVKDSGEATYKEMIESETTKVMVQASTLDGLPGYNDSVYKSYIGVCPIHSYKTSGNLIPNYSKDHKKFLDYAVLDYIFSRLRNNNDKSIFEKWLGMENNTVTSQCEGA